MIKLTKLWILASAACVSAGWILSALHQLNLAGYAVFFFVFAAGLAVVCARRRRGTGVSRTMVRAKWVRRSLRRFRRPLPLLFFLTATLAFAGGVAHAPNNYDALTYRFPRVLHWWSAGGWHWIATPNERMNLSGTAFEWLMMPLFVVTHSDRLFFLINTAAYVLLPGLVFVVFVAAGVARRVAWFWMWLLPAALCYAMQAGSISNDTIAATYFLAALYFAFQARRAWNVRNLWLAFLAAGLLTGVKASNLPLLLPVAWAIWPALRLVEKRFAISLVVILGSLLVSFLPMALLNQHYTGDWSGDPNNIEKMHLQKPLIGILGNGLQLGLQSLEPPFLPLARTAETWVWEHFPETVREHLTRGFPHFVVGFRELPQEESSGVGIGITLITLLSIAAAWRYRGWKQPHATEAARRQGLTIGVLTWVALLVYMSKLGSEATSRLIAAYYPLLLLPFLLNPAQSFLVRRGWYRTMAVCAAAIALTAVILTPSRPLWPAESFFDWAGGHFPQSLLLARAKTVYTVYRSRNDPFAGLRRSIPESIPVIGLIESIDDPEASLWRPFGARRVVDLLELRRIADSGLQWVVVKNNVFGLDNSKAFDEWLGRTGGVLIAQQTITEKAGTGPEQWSVVHIPSASN
jgi:hypothetical protein